MKLKKEIPLISIVLLPLLYLFYIWNDLPNKVAIHWNFKGEIDRYGDKMELILIPLLLPLLTYVLFSVIPNLDPKKNLDKMGGKFWNIKFLTTIFMSGIALLIIHSAKNSTLENPNYLTLMIGTLFVILGNYFKTIKANYFLGIRTPWTLESETVWKATHILGGIMWFVGGICVIISSLFLETSINFIVFLCITGIISIVPIFYSYLVFQKTDIAPPA